MTDNLLAADGRVIGSRAKATRLRLLDATAKLLRSHGVLELKVVDITREAGTSPATFYQYFADVDTVLLALAETAGENEKARCCRCSAPTGMGPTATPGLVPSWTPTWATGMTTRPSCAAGT